MPVSPAGRPRRRLLETTERDGAVLRLVGEQFALTDAQLAVVLGHFNVDHEGPVSASAVRKQRARWAAAGLTRSERCLGKTWTTLTGLGYGRVDLAYPLWPFPLTRLAHVEAVATVRLLLLQRDPSTATVGWCSERRLRALRGSATWHIGDAALLEPGLSPLQHPHRLIEVELTPKSRERYSLEVFSRLSRYVAAIDYFAPEQLVARLQNDLDAVRAQRHPELQVPLRVHAMPATLRLDTP